ncbi:MAG: hypothetical protein JW797_10905 [Bradymonadales bacterium]|nr:hypothetical protein [Bradymonadales bacterium]
MNDNDEAQLTYWLDVLDEVVNGRRDGLSCPFCGSGVLKVEVAGVRVSVKCPSCGKYFEGRLP